MCKKSESITNLAVSLVKFNSKVQRIEKDGTNPHFKNRYTTLDAILDEIRPMLAEEGLSVIQMPSGDADQLKLTTLLIHISGEWIESDSISMRPVKNDPQGVGAATTYARRYSLCAFLGLSTGDIDDDGNSVSIPPKAVQNAHPPRGNNNPPTPPQSSTSQSSAPHSFKREAYKLREDHFMGWDDLQKVAERVLGRKLTKVTQLQDEKEWEMIVNDIKSYNRGA